jgi:hypothetical protein
MIVIASRRDVMPDTTPTKEDLVTAIDTERRYWDALVAVVEQGRLMDRPGANNGPWTFKDMTVHLNGWRGLTVARLEAASRGAGPPAHPWPADLGEESPETIDAINAWFYERGRDQTASEVLAESTAQFDAMRATVVAMSPDDLLTPGHFAWFGDLPVGPAVLGYSFTHLHTDHDPDIRAWLRRETGTVPALPPAPPTFGYNDG